MPESNDTLGLCGLIDVIGYGGLIFPHICSEENLPDDAPVGTYCITPDGKKTLVFTGVDWAEIGCDASLEPPKPVRAAKKYANCPCCGAPVNRGDTCTYCGCLYPLI